MRTLGKLLQLVGLTIPPITIAIQLSNSIGTREMLIALVASVCAFILGRLIEGYARG